MDLSSRRPLDQAALILIRNMKYCSRKCPAFVQCPMMPLAIQPKGENNQLCLINHGDIRLKVAYFKLFAGGGNGIIQLMQAAILEYKKVLDSEKLTPKDRMRANEKLVVMLNNLHKMMTKNDLKGGKKEAEEEMDEIVLVASENEKPDPESLQDSPKLQELLSRPKPPEPTIEDELAKTLNQFLPEEKS